MKGVEQDDLMWYMSTPTINRPPPNKQKKREREVVDGWIGGCVFLGGAPSAC